MALPVRVAVGRADVIASETLVVGDAEPIRIFVGPDPSPLEIEIVFNKADNSESAVSVAVPGSQQVLVTFTNFGSALGSATVTPLSVGRYNNRDLLLSVASSLIGTSPTGVARTIAFTLILSGTVNE